MCVLVVHLLNAQLTATDIQNSNENAVHLAPGHGFFFFSSFVGLIFLYLLKTETAYHVRAEFDWDDDTVLAL